MPGVGPSLHKTINTATTPSTDKAVTTSTTATSTATVVIPQFLPATEKNILHKYRSWTYNFAFGAISPSAVSDNSLLASDIMKYPVLNSAGKGTRGTQLSQNKNSALDQSKVSKLVQGFNTKSAGRFDMYIDDVEIESLVGAGSPQSGNSIATNITFNVYEPYSMNGFFEAMHVAAVAAGYTDYSKGAFALRVQFQGYDDKSIDSPATIIPLSTRYFMLTITNATVDISEAGTRYKVEAVPLTQTGFAQTTNSSKTDIKVAGTTIKDVLIDYFKALNEGERKIRENSTSADKGKYNWYEISAPQLTMPGNKQNTKKARLWSPDPQWTASSSVVNSKLIDSPMNDGTKSNNSPAMTAPSSASGKSGYVGQTNYQSPPAGNNNGAGTNATNTQSSATSTGAGVAPAPANNGAFTFSAGSNIQDNIAAIIRDSSYVRKLLQTEIDKAKQGDGLVTYFSIRMELELRDWSEADNDNFKTIRYVIEPYQIHYSRIPGQQAGSDTAPAIKEKIKREYNYIYTGQNLDIVKFNINFNSLFFSAMPVAMGNVTRAPGSTSEAKGNQSNVKQPSNGTANDALQKVGTQPATVSTKQDPNLNKSVQGGSKAGQTLEDPYYSLAKALNTALLESVDQVQASITILGDPYFLCTGGMGNTDLELAESMKTIDGQMPYTQGDAYVFLAFRNPIDINTLEKGGLLSFDNQLIEFSGVYRVNTLKNHFKNGEFTQDLELIRLDGHKVTGTDVKPQSLVTSSMKDAQVSKDTAKNVLTTGVRPSDFNLTNMLNRGLPSPGLPGIASNFTNGLVGSLGAGGSILSSSAPLTQVTGALGSAQNAINTLNVGNTLGGVNALSSGIRLSASGLQGVGTSIASGLSVANNSLGSIVNLPGSAVNLASNVASAASTLPTTAINAVNNLFNSGASTIGNIENAISSAASSAGNAISSTVASLEHAASNIGSTVAGAVNGIADKVSSIQNPFSSIDTSGITSKLGINPSLLAGLDPKLQTQLTSQLSTLASQVPANTNIAGLQSLGVSFGNITGDTISNLPALQPNVTAPNAVPNTSDIKSIISSGGKISDLTTSIPVADLTNLNNVTNGVGQITAGLTSGLGGATAITDKLSVAQSQLQSSVASVAGIPSSLTNPISSSVAGFAPATMGFGSVESNKLNVQNLTQNVTGAAGNLGMSLSSQFGSLQSSSPLTTLVQKNNLGLG